MKVYLNKTKVRRRHNLGRGLVVLGLAMLAGGFVYSLLEPEATGIVLLVALAGTLLAQAGIPLLRRWGSEPRADQALEAAFKGLDDRWLLLHYLPGVDHALFGPAGPMALLPRQEDGRIELDAQAETLIQDKPKSGLLRRGGRTDIDGLRGKAAAQGERLTALVNQFEASESNSAQARAALLFMSDEAEVDVSLQDADPAAVHYKRLKDWIRRQPKRTAPDEASLMELAQSHDLDPR